MHPYWLSVGLQIRFQKLAESGRIHRYIPSHWIGTDREGNYRCLAWLDFAADSYIIVETGMRAQSFPVNISDILSQIAVFDLCEELEHVITGAADPEARHVLDELLRFYQKNFEWCSSVA